jgi:hypothetical protein
MTRRLLLFPVIVLYSSIALAQVSNTLYFMDRLPQATQLNPAVQPKCDVYFGFPGLSSVQFDMGNNSLSLNDILSYNADLDSMITFMHPLANLHNNEGKNKFINTLKDQNSIFTNFQIDVLAFGFRVKEMYFTCNYTIKTNFSASYPKDMARFMMYLADSIATYDFKGFGLNSTVYGELGIGVSRVFDDFTFGIKTKLLSGLADVSTINDQFQLKTNVVNHMFDLTINSKTTFNIYDPYHEFRTDSAGETKFDSIVSKDNPMDYFKPFESIGLGFDFGAIYTGVDKFVFSASVIDLGFINWKNNVYNLKTKNSYHFTGPSIDFYKDTLDFFSAISDSLKESSKFVQTRNSYTSWLPTKIFLGAEYYPVSFASLGLLSISQYYRQKFSQQIMASVNFRPGKMNMISLNYSFFDNGFSYIGIGMASRVGPFNTYFMTDNMPVQFGKFDGVPILPYKLKNFNYRFGINFVFGCGNRKLKDKPLMVD